MRRLLLVLAFAGGCRDAAPLSGDAPPDAASIDPEPDAAIDPEPDAAIDPKPDAAIDPKPDAGVEPLPPLTIRFLGVGGFSITAGADRVLTAPFYSNPDLGSVLTGEVRSDHAAVDRFLDPLDVAGTQALLVGHAHYDHLMDVPYVFQRTPEATIYGNVAAKRLLAAFAPEPVAGCTTSTVPRPPVPRERVVALNDPADDRVDYRMCAEPQGRCAGAWDGGAGAWVDVPSSRVRIRALCSMHPDQFLIFHLGGGCMDADQCAPPRSASDWREGSTSAFLIDFLGAGGAPIYRVYYQDAPTDGPVGYPHPDLLAEKRVDVAILCTGNYDQVRDQPQDTIAALSPRYVIAGHWESFFRSQGEPLADIPFLDVGEYVRRMEEALPEPADVPIQVDGAPSELRGFKPDPGTTFVVSPE